MKYHLTLLISMLFLLGFTASDEDDELLFYINYDWQPYTMQVDGTENQQFMDMPGLINPDLSPTRREGVAAYLDREIYRFDLEKQTLFQVTETIGDNYHPRISPDGKRIAFVSTRDGYPQIYVMNYDGSDQTRIRSKFADGHTGLTWVLDNQHIVFVRSVSLHFDVNSQTYEDQQLYLVNLEYDTVTLLTGDVNECPAGELYFNPDWTAGHLAFSMGCGELTNLYLVFAETEADLQNFDYQNITQGMFWMPGVLDISWSGTGSRLAFTEFSEDDTVGVEIIIGIMEDDHFSYSQVATSPPTSTFYGLTWFTP